MKETPGWRHAKRLHQRTTLIQRNDTNLSYLNGIIDFMNHSTLLAAIDLGSNSFRLEIGRNDHGQIQRIDYLKETVRLGNGFDDERNLSLDAMTRGWECLARFAERLSGFQPHQVRAVATQTLREARNREAFLQRGSAILGFPIEVIAGTEEARLIYQGVANLLPHNDERRLVIDIGGRSTELVLGLRTQTLETASYRVGSVAWSMKYFPKGEFTEQAIYSAEIAAQAVLDEALSRYPRSQWDRAYGASGTVGAVADILALAGWPPGQISMEGLSWLIKCLLRAGNASSVRLEGLKDERRAVLGGGVCVLRGLMDLLHIDTLFVAQGALRHGVLFEMLDGNGEKTDTRDASVQRLAQKFNVDLEQGLRVRNVSTYLLEKIISPSEPAATQLKRKLGWAAQLHEVGMAVSHSDYHKHSAYILQNADMLGFGMQELYRLGLLVLGHRGKLKKLETEFDEPEFAKLLLALRLAIILCHARKNPETDSLRLTCNNKQGFKLVAEGDWALRYPQSAHLLRQESLAWQKTAWSFEFIGS